MFVCLHLTPPLGMVWESVTGGSLHVQKVANTTDVCIPANFPGISGNLSKHGQISGIFRSNLQRVQRPHCPLGPCIYRFFHFRFQICERKTKNQFLFRFSFSNLRTKNEKRIPFSFFVFKSEVRKTNSFFVFHFQK